jgi:uncharacterized protein (TIGR02145 family)
MRKALLVITMLMISSGLFAQKKTMVIQKVDGTYQEIEISNSVWFKFNLPCESTPTVSYEGKTYNTIQIGDQCWLRENLDVGTRIDGSQNMSDNGTLEKYCYEDAPDSCEELGGLYQWDEAMQYSLTEGAQGICPSGWHIPTLTEFEELESYVNDEAKKVKAVGEDDNSTNETGFSALLGGWRNDANGDFNYVDFSAHLWTSSENNIISANGASLFIYSYDSTVLLGGWSKSGGLSVRCIKD